jgi:hypothetical protein
MKRVLKDLNTGLFFKNMDQWTTRVDEAANFRDTISALKFCEKNNFTGIAVLLIPGSGPHRMLAFRRGTSSQPTKSVDLSLALAQHPTPG